MIKNMKNKNQFELLLDDLDTCARGAPCADCKQPKAWNCDWMLMERARDAIAKLLLLLQLDKSEIVRLRRQVEVLQMSEDEKLKDLREGNRSPYRRET